MPKAPLSVINNGKCPFLTPALNCMSTGFGTVECFDHKFHSECEHRLREEARWKKTEEKNAGGAHCDEDRVH